MLYSTLIWGKTNNLDISQPTKGSDHGDGDGFLVIVTISNGSKTGHTHWRLDCLENIYIHNDSMMIKRRQNENHQSVSVSGERLRFIGENKISC